jgi:hypothetical protein
MTAGLIVTFARNAFGGRINRDAVTGVSFHDEAAGQLGLAWKPVRRLT